ncbi:hypothetical protein QYF36_025674 [Acer negundo]|nr:hypothetical protein QYF36_025674 [Acer negundo]
MSDEDETSDGMGRAVGLCEVEQQRGSEEKEGDGELVSVRKVVVTANLTQPNPTQMKKKKNIWCDVFFEVEVDEEEEEMCVMEIGTRFVFRFGFWWLDLKKRRIVEAAAIEMRAILAAIAAVFSALSEDDLVVSFST